MKVAVLCNAEQSCSLVDRNPKDLHATCLLPDLNDLCQVDSPQPNFFQI